MSEVKKEETSQLQETGTDNQGAESQVQQQEKGKGVLGTSMEATQEFLKNVFDWTVFWWEFCGTALFAYGICASDGNDWFVTLSLFAGLAIVAPFSGGHLNPAVSFGFFIKNGIIPNPETNQTSWNLKDLLGRSCAQFFGACTGGFLAVTILGMSAAPMIPSEDWRMLGGYFTGEAFGTMIFVLTILIMTDKRTQLIDEPVKDQRGNVVPKPPGFIPDNLAVYFTIAMGLHISRSFTYKTGGGLNPGIAVGLQIWLAIDKSTWEPLIHSWLFIIGPMLGAAISAYYYSYFHLAATNKTGIFADKKDELEQSQQPAENNNNDQNA